MSTPLHKRPSRWRQEIRATIRDTFLLVREFGWPLLFFTIAIIGGGLLYFELAQLAREPVDGRAEAVYLILSLTFLQPLADFPAAWYLQTFYFLMPLIGLGILAQGLTDFGVLFFNRKARSKEWEMAVASTFNNHIVLVGLGHLGFRVAESLYELDQATVVIELNPKAELVDRAKAMGIPVLEDDGKKESALIAAGIEKARTVVLCTQNDSMNLQAALKARQLNPDIRVVIRIFDFEFAKAIQDQFGFRALSATGMSAPTFASAASGVDVTRPITVEGQALSLASLVIAPGSRLEGCPVSDIEQRYDLSVVLMRHDHDSDFHPAGDRCLAAGDTLAVLAGPPQISLLVDDNLPG